MYVSAVWEVKYRYLNWESVRIQNWIVFTLKEIDKMIDRSASQANSCFRTLNYSIPDVSPQSLDGKCDI